jgi:hypothetical protein
MPYKTGEWGEQAKLRNKKRLKYFRQYQKNKKLTQLPLFNGFGSIGEKIGLHLLPNSKLVRKNSHDIEWNNKKIEVKISKFMNQYHGWSFHTKRQKKKCDYFLLICTDKKREKVLRIYFISEKFVPQTHVTVINSNKCKYEKFRLESEVNSNGKDLNCIVK